LRHFRDPEDRASRRRFREIFCKDGVQAIVVVYVFEIHLYVDHVLQIQAGSGEDRFDIFQRLGGLGFKIGRNSAVTALRTLAGDIDVVARVNR